MYSAELKLVVTRIKAAVELFERTGDTYLAKDIALSREFRTRWHAWGVTPYGADFRITLWYNKPDIRIFGQLYPVTGANAAVLIEGAPGDYQNSFESPDSTWQATLNKFCSIVLS